MAPRSSANAVKQQWAVKGGTLQLILSTAHPLTSNELGDVEMIAAACSMYEEKWPPESKRQRLMTGEENV